MWVRMWKRHLNLSWRSDPPPRSVEVAGDRRRFCLQLEHPVLPGSSCGHTARPTGPLDSRHATSPKGRKTGWVVRSVLARGLEFWHIPATESFLCRPSGQTLLMGRE